MVDQQQQIIDLLSQIVQNSSKITQPHASDVTASTSYSQMTVMPKISLPLQSTPATAPSSSLQEDTTDDDYDFINSPSWISLISDKSTGDPESNSEHNNTDVLLPPLYDASNYVSVPPQLSEMSQSASTYTTGHSIMPIMNPQAVVSTQHSHPISPLPQQTQLFTPTQTFVPPPPPFNTPPKLHAVEEVMRDHQGTDVNSLRRLATAIAREAIFGKKELQLV